MNLLDTSYLQINLRNAAIPARDSMQELYDSIAMTLKNMNQLSDFETKKEELNQLGKRLENDKLRDNESSLLSNQYFHLQQQVSIHD